MWGLGFVNKLKVKVEDKASFIHLTCVLSARIQQRARQVIAFLERLSSSVETSLHVHNLISDRGKWCEE